MTSDALQDKVLDLAKKRGIFWTSYEVYGGVAGFYDFGPIGVLIKRNIADLWLKTFVYSRQNVVEVETPIIGPRIVFKASGHEEHFTDPILECSRCGRSYRADHLIKDALGLNVEGWSIEEINKIVKEHNPRCPECGGEFNPGFNALLLFTTQIGPYKGEIGYLRPEHAQGMFINFSRVLRIMRDKLPLGIAQIGKVARNEISPRQGLIRLREFTIMEVEFFFDPEEASREVKEVIDEIRSEKLRIITAEMRLKNLGEPVELSVEEVISKEVVKTPWLAYWMGIGNKFVKCLGIPHDKIRFVEKLQNERAHYSQQTFDQEVYTSRFGWVEVAGYAYRTSYDLERHAMYSKGDFTYFKKYEKPVTQLVKKALPNPEAIESLVGKPSFPGVMEKLASRDPSDLYSELASKGYVEVNGIKIPQDYFYVKDEEVKVYGKKIYPHVVEPSFGLERLLYVVLEYSYTERDGKTVLKLPLQIAPYHVAVFPLLTGKKPEHIKMIEVARSIYKDLVKHGFRALYDEEGSIGRRYARSDEIGVPFAITVDYQTLQDNTATVRDRDTTRQERVSIDKIKQYLMEKFSAVIY